MFNSKPNTPLAGRGIIYKITCNRCEWEKEEIVWGMKEYFKWIKRKLKERELKLKYPKCPQCGSKVKIKMRLLIS